MKRQLIDYRDLVKDGISYSDLDIEDKRHADDFVVRAYTMVLAFDEILENQKKLEQKNQELEAKLDRVIQLLENK